MPSATTTASVRVIYYCRNSKYTLDVNTYILIPGNVMRVIHIFPMKMYILYSCRISFFSLTSSCIVPSTAKWPEPCLQRGWNISSRNNINVIAAGRERRKHQNNCNSINLRHPHPPQPPNIKIAYRTKMDNNDVTSPTTTHSNSSNSNDDSNTSTNTICRVFFIFDKKNCIYIIYIYMCIIKLIIIIINKLRIWKKDRNYRIPGTYRYIIRSLYVIFSILHDL